MPYGLFRALVTGPGIVTIGRMARIDRRDFLEATPVAAGAFGLSGGRPGRCDRRQARGPGEALTRRSAALRSHRPQARRALALVRPVEALDDLDQLARRLRQIAVLAIDHQR